MAKVWHQVIWYENNRCTAYVLAEKGASDDELLDAARNDTDYDNVFDDYMDEYEVEEHEPSDSLKYSTMATEV